MLRKVRAKLTYPHVMSTLAVFLAIGSGTFAVASLKRNTVGAKQIKTNAVRSPEIKANAVKNSELADNAVGAAEVVDDSLGGSDVNESSLGQVPSATNADQLDGNGPGAFLGAGDIRADGNASGAEINDFTTTSFTSLISKEFTAPSNGFALIVGAISAEDDGSLAGNGLLRYRLRVNDTPVTDTFHELDYENGVGSSGDSGAMTVIAPVSAGANTVHLDAREDGAGSFIVAREISVLFVPNGSAPSLPF